MSVYMITYELHHDRDYQKIQDGIRSLGGCIHCLRSVWFVKTSFSLSEIHEILKDCVDADDSILIMKTANEWDSINLPIKCKSWLKHHK
jgi:hypothetical protein